MKIFSIVDRQRYGLLEHSEAFTAYARLLPNLSAKTIYHRDMAPSEQDAQVYSIKQLLIAAWKRKLDCLLLWSVGPTYLLLPLIKLLNPDLRTIVVCHEPGGFRQRMNKKDPILYALLVSAYEWFFLRFADTVVTPNMQNSAKFRMGYAPLIFERIDGSQAQNRDSIVHLGRRSAARSIELFCGKNRENLLAKLDHKIQFNFFPTATQKTTSEKATLMQRAVCTVNLYKIQHNQSGVTPDSLRFEVPVIVSELDAFSPLIRAYGAGVVLSLNDISTDSIASAVSKICNDFDAYSKAAARMFDDHFGLTAFKTYWVPLLAAVEPDFTPVCQMSSKL